jgi:cytochrome c-type biogenesis protein CcmH
MVMGRQMLRLIVLFAIALAAFAQTPDRALRLKQKLMAPCCWAEPVAGHNSPAAQEMRTEIDRLVAAGVSDAAIVEKFKAQYGSRILAEPDGSAGLWLTTIPIVLTLVGAAWVVLLLRKWKRGQPPPAQALPSVPEVG